MIACVGRSSCDGRRDQCPARRWRWLCQIPSRVSDLARVLIERHHWRWKEFRRRHTTPEGRWLPITGGADRPGSDRRDTGHPVPLPRRQRSPAPGACQNTPDGRNRGEPVALRGAAGSASGLDGASGNAGTALQADSSRPWPHWPPGHRNRAMRCGMLGTPGMPTLSSTAP
jgi:hypothetical protein